MANYFVFGSNLAGIHGAGAAAYAHRNLGAVWGVGRGITGQCYALPTKDAAVRTLPLNDIEGEIRIFFALARERQDDTFILTPVGCGLAGYRPYDILRLLKANNMPRNVVLASSWITDYEW